MISADSHPVSGGFVFVVGNATAPSTTVADLLDDDSGAVTGTAFAAVRAVQFASIALGLGAVLFVLACWLPGVGVTARAEAGWDAASLAFAGRLRALLLIAALAGALSAAAALALQGAVAGGTPVWDALSTSVIGDVLGTRFGLVWGVGLLVWLLVGGLAAARAPAPVVAVPLAALAALPALGGHGSVQSPVALLLPANILHVVAISAWFGGVAVLVLALRRATARLEAGERTRLLAAVVGRFSALAGLAIAVVLASGVVQGVVEVRTLANLVETAFGRAVLVKIVLFGGIVALGYVNRRRLLPALERAARGGETPGRAGLLLRRTLRIELVLGLAALAATGALAGYAPSVAESGGPFSGDADIGPARLELTVDPARVGPNEMHVYLFDRRDGSQFDATKELTVTAALPEKRIAPIELEPTKAGPGHYVVSGAALGVAGDWNVEIVSRVSDFDEYRARLTVPIR